MKLEALIGKIVLCNNQYIRRLLSVSKKTVNYEVPITNTVWRQLNATWRASVEQEFLEGQIFETAEEACIAVHKIRKEAMELIGL